MIKFSITSRRIHSKVKYIYSVFILFQKTCGTIEFYLINLRLAEIKINTFSAYWVFSACVTNYHFSAISTVATPLEKKIQKKKDPKCAEKPIKNENKKITHPKDIRLPSIVYSKIPGFALGSIMLKSRELSISKGSICSVGCDAVESQILGWKFDDRAGMSSAASLIDVPLDFILGRSSKSDHNRQHAAAARQSNV